MQAVILAAGRSSRFEPFTSLPHKSMVKLLGKSLLEHTLLKIKKTGIEDIVIIVGEKSSIPEIIGNGEKLGVKIQYITHIGAQGAGAALLDAKEVLEERFFLIHPYRLDFPTYVKEMTELQTDDRTVVLLAKKPTSTIYGVMEINGQKVTGVIEKPEKILDNHLQIIGTYLLNKTFVGTLETMPKDHYSFEAALDKYAQQQHMTFLLTKNETISLKYSWDLLAIKNYLLKDIENYKSPSAVVSDHAVIEGSVFIDEGAHVMEGAIIKGPVYIGKNAIVGTAAILRNGVDIEANAVIGARLEMKNSILGEGSTTHSGFLGDSVIGKNTKIAAYVCTANARLDREPVMTLIKGEKTNTGLKHLGLIVGDNANIGIRVSTMPGVIIGEGSIVGPGTTVMKNVAPHKKYYTKFAEVVEDAK